MICKKIKTKLFNYINYADFIVILSMFLTSIISFELQSISSYLDKKKDRDERIEKYPLRNYEINYISYSAYQTITGRMEINDFLLKQEQENNNILLSVQNQTTKMIKNKNIKTGIFDMKDSVSDYLSTSLNSIQEQSKTGNIPQEGQKQKNKENNEYFIVQYGDGKRYNPKDVKKTGKAQARNIDGKYVSDINDKSDIVVGSIGGQNIKKESIKETIINIWNTALNIKKKRNRGIVVNTDYDKYGNRIVNNNYKNSISNNKTSNILSNDKNYQQNNNTLYMQNIILDGELQQVKEKLSLNNSALSTIYDKKTLIAIIKLEYELETCWSEFATKYNNTGISYTYIVEYDINKKPKNIKFVRKNVPIIQQEKTINFKKDIKTTIEKCDISKINDLNNKNYKFWQEIKITFKGNK